MKKLVALMLTLMFVMGLAAYAAAEVAISGDARVRGVYTNNLTDMDDDVNDHTRYYDQRIRLNLDAKNDDEAQVKMQWTTGEDTWGTNGATPSSGYAVGYTRAENYAYVLVPFGDYKVEAGLMPADWGNKFWAWGLAKERLKVYTKMDDMTVGAFTEKATENPTGGAGGQLEDYDAYAAYVVAPMGDLKAGLIVVYAKNDAKQKEDTGHKVDAFVNGKMGDMSLAGEIFYNGGDLNKSDKDADGKGDDAKMAAFVQVGMAMDSLNVSGAVAMSQNDGAANKYFTPTALFGTSQPTAVTDFGDDYDTLAVVIGVSSKVGDAMTVGVKGAYAKADAYYDADKGSDWTITEVDGTFTYTIGDNTKYEAVVAYGKPDSDVAGAANDNILAAMHGLYINF